jgi:ferredoxin-NADP reductase/Na+-translocating ferredoxin:NAD+ oxidoreductase RnfD subunit
MIKIWKIIQAWIDKTTMYMVVLYSLGALVICSFVGRIFNQVPFSLLSLLSSVILAVGFAYGSSVLVARITKIEANHLSSVITALIVFFLVNPAESWNDIFVLVAAVILAVISKYIFVFRGQHIFNPAAISLFLLGLFKLGYATWWISSLFFVIPLILAGSLVVTKVRRWTPVVSFLTVGFIVYYFETLQVGDGFGESLYGFFVSYPAIFLGAFMLTEPFTMPGTRRTQLFYGALVGFLFSTTIFKSLFIMYPEIALLLGNLAVYGFTLKRKLKLKFIKMREIASNTYEFSFEKPLNLKFTAGQYLEWMMPHDKSDKRGIRRFFTIASSPTENVLKIALKFPESTSSFKQALKNLKVGNVIIASQLSGDFTLPKDTSKKIAMVAGGIGVTPFRSQIKQMIDKNEFRDTVLFYCNNTKEEVAYSGLFVEAENKLPLQTVYVLAKEQPAPEYETGYLSAEIIKKYAPDLLQRVWYVSGPPMMVNSTTKILKELGVSTKNIVKDFFPGLA